MTLDEHIRKAEEYLRDAELSMGANSVQRATAQATLGLLHLGLAAAKPIVALAPGHGPDEAARAALERLEATDDDA